MKTPSHPTVGEFKTKTTIALPRARRVQLIDKRYLASHARSLSYPRADIFYRYVRNLVPFLVERRHKIYICGTENVV